MCPKFDEQLFQSNSCFFQLPRFMNDTRSWRTPLVPYRRNMKLTIPSWFWLPPVFPVFLLQQFCSFCHITASTDSSIPSRIFWVVPKEVKLFQLRLNSFHFHSFCIAVQIEMQEPWNSRTIQLSKKRNHKFLIWNKHDIFHC